MPALPPHFANAQPVPDLVPDVEFHCRPAFELVSARLRAGSPAPVSLPVPDGTRRGVLLSSAAVVPQLARYYQAVVQAARARDLDPRGTGARHYFWIRPVLRRADTAVFGFPWYDAYPEAAHVLSLLGGSARGPLLDDQDQGWHFQLYATVKEFFLRQGDDDEGRYEPACVTDRARLGKLARATHARLRQQLRELVSGVGNDYWQFNAA